MCGWIHVDICTVLMQLLYFFSFIELGDEAHSNTTCKCNVLKVVKFTIIIIIIIIINYY